MNFVYKIYESRLKKRVKKTNNMPRHIGLILDGNRRGSQKIGVPLKTGYSIGAQVLENVLEWSWDLGIEVVSLWVMSTHNLDRNEEDKENIFSLAKDYIIKLREDPRIHKRGVQIRFSGELYLLDEDIQKEITIAEKVTEKYENHVINVCFAYGGREELVHATKKIARQVKDGNLDPDEISEEMISSYLYTSGLPDADLIIRTSGEIRIGGFLLWQAFYAELYFTDIYWPLFREIDFLRAIRSYQQRSRRFGK